MTSTSVTGPRRPLPVRTILATIGLVLLTTLALALLYTVRQILVWIVVALFFSIALYPVVGWVQRRLARGHRVLATLLVFGVVVLAVAGLLALFAVPLATQGAAFAAQFPQLLDDARSGRGVIGRLLTRTHAIAYVEFHQDQIRSFATGLTTPAAGVLKGVAAGAAGVVTVFVLTLLMVLEAPKIVDGTLNLIDDDESREHVRRVAEDCAKSITGYISGNLLISVICGALTYTTLKIMGASRSPA